MLKRIFKLIFLLPLTFAALALFSIEVSAQSLPDADPVIYNGQSIKVLIEKKDSEDNCTGLKDIVLIVLQDGSTMIFQEYELKDDTRSVLDAGVVGTFTFEVLYVQPGGCDFDWSAYDGTDDDSKYIPIFSRQFTGDEFDCVGNCPAVNQSRSQFEDGKYILRIKNPLGNGKCFNGGKYKLLTNSGETFESEDETGTDLACDVRFGLDLVHYLEPKANDNGEEETYSEVFALGWGAWTIGEVRLCYDAKKSVGYVGECDDSGNPDPGEIDIDLTCEGLKNADDRENCAACFAKNDAGDSTSAFVWSELGCFDTSQNGFTVRIFQIGFGLYGGIVLVRVGMAALAMQDRDPAKIKEFREILNAALWSLAALAGAIPILQFLGLNVLGIFPSNFFT